MCFLTWLNSLNLLSKFNIPYLSQTDQAIELIFNGFHENLGIIYSFVSITPLTIHSWLCK